MRIIVGITGATGAILGIRILEALRKQNVETHTVISRWAETTIRLETDYDLRYISEISNFVYANSNLAAPISSGSFITDGMIIAPCSMKTLAAIRIGFSETLISRAADVTLKERRKLVILPRETPLNAIHLENMLTLCRAGAVIFPPVPAFYNKPVDLDDVIRHIVARVLDQFGLVTTDLTTRWFDDHKNQKTESPE
ncbi:MAG: UbiX family flavin prenyltransferase [Alicyclobacillaceae bacterium]|nr:UbiX family flavin prenyltransferase [Alicyclobacillaceae bacterium]